MTALLGYAPGERAHVRFSSHDGIEVDGPGVVTFYSRTRDSDIPADVRVLLDDGTHVGCREDKLTRLGEREVPLCLDLSWEEWPAPVCICTRDEGHEGDHACGALDASLAPLCTATWEVDR